MKFFILSFFFLLVFTESEAKISKRKANKTASPIRSEMTSIATNIELLAPFIASEQEFIKDSNKETVLKGLSGLSDKFMELKSHPALFFEGLNINQQIMTDQLEQTVVLFKNDKRPIARAKLNAALNLCVSCHSQTSQGLKKEATQFLTLKQIEELKISDFDRAEIYFISRVYDKSVGIYEKFLLSSKASDDDELVYRAFERMLIYYIKIKKSFPEAKKHFESILAKNKFNPKVTQEVLDWIKTLSGQSLWEKFEADSVKEEEMEKFLKTFISDDEDGPFFVATNSSEVYDLNLSAILLDYYNSHPDSKLGARILYWLAILDKRTSDDLFFSLGDYYLLMCMEKYSKDPVAKDCYEAYMEDLQFNYISKEKDLPIDIKIRLQKIEKTLGVEAKKE